jgi:hypothetical protein
MRCLPPGLAAVLVICAVGCQQQPGPSAAYAAQPERQADKSKQPSANATAFKPQVAGKLGSPSATTTIDGQQLPAPDPKFGGVIKDDALQSKAWWAPRIVPPKQAPNV